MNNLSNLTMEDLTFLKDLAKELRTQDGLATAKPLVYKIRETVLEPYQDLWFVDEDEICLMSPRNKIHLTVQDVLETLESDYPRDYQRVMKAVSGMEDLSYQSDLKAFADVLDTLTLDWNWTLTGYKEAEKVSGSFLTARAAEAHLKENRHHYNDTAHIYCTHGWRNPELEQLLTIIEKFDC